MNKEQSFRIIPRKNDYIYCYGQFYKIEIPIGKSFNKSDFNIGNILIPKVELIKISTEKGSATINENEWGKIAYLE